MMRNILFIIALAAAGAFSASAYQDNWQGLLDTAEYFDTLDAIHYTKSFRLSAFEDSRVILMANIDSTAKFGTDSIHLHWGYQTFSLVYDSANTVDTAFDVPVVLDTMDVDSFGIQNYGATDAAGALTKTLHCVDTTNVLGNVYQTKWFVPEWDSYIRFWMAPLTKQAAGSDMRARFQYIRRVIIPTRNR